MAKNIGGYDRVPISDSSESRTTPVGESPHDDGIRKKWVASIQARAEEETASESETDKEDPDSTPSVSAPTAKFTDADVHHFLLQLPSPVLNKVKYHLLTSVHIRNIKRPGSATTVGVNASSGHVAGPLHLPSDISGSAANPGPRSGSGSNGPAERAAGLGSGSSDDNSNPRSDAAELSALPTSGARPRQRPLARVETSSPLSRALSTRFFGPPWTRTCSPSKPGSPAAGATPTPTPAADTLRRQRRNPAPGSPPPPLHIAPRNPFSAGIGVLPGSLRPSGPGVSATGSLFGLPPPVHQGPSPTADADEKSDRRPLPEELEADVPASAATAKGEKPPLQEFILARGCLSTSPSLFNVDASSHTKRGEGSAKPSTPSSLGFGSGDDGGDVPPDGGLAGGRDDMVGNDDDNEDDATGSCTIIRDEGPRHVSESVSGQQNINGEHAHAPAPAPAPGAARIAALESSMLKRRPLPSDYLASQRSPCSRCRSRSRSRNRNRHKNNNNNIGRRAAGTHIQGQGLVGFDLYRTLIRGAAPAPPTEEDRDGDGVLRRDAQGRPSVPPDHAGAVGAADAVTGGRPSQDFLGRLPGTATASAIAVSPLPPKVDVETGNTNGDDGDGDRSSHDGESDEKGEPTNANTAASSRVDTQYAVREWVGKVRGLAERTKELWYGLLDVQRELANISMEMRGVKVILE